MKRAYWLWALCALVTLWVAGCGGNGGEGTTDDVLSGDSADQNDAAGDEADAAQETASEDVGIADFGSDPGNICTPGYYFRSSDGMCIPDGDTAEPNEVTETTDDCGGAVCNDYCKLKGTEWTCRAPGGDFACTLDVLMVEVEGQCGARCEEGSGHFFLNAATLSFSPPSDPSTFSVPGIDGTGQGYSCDRVME